MKIGIPHSIHSYSIFNGSEATNFPSKPEFYSQTVNCPMGKRKILTGIGNILKLQKKKYKILRMKSVGLSTLTFWCDTSLFTGLCILCSSEGLWNVVLYLMPIQTGTWPPVVHFHKSSLVETIIRHSWTRESHLCREVNKTKIQSHVFKYSLETFTLH